MDDAIVILNSMFSNNMMDTYNFRIAKRGDKYQLVTYEGTETGAEPALFPNVTKTNLRNVCGRL